MKEKATATDVAKRANVSRTAVSQVLSGAKNVRLSKDTRHRIIQAAEALHYSPNASGRSLARGKTETIGLVLRDIAMLDIDPYLPPLLNGIIKRSREEGYGVLVESVSLSRNNDEFGDLMNSGRIDGMILENPDFEDKTLSRLIKAGRPIVVLGSLGIAEEYSVAIDDKRAGMLATDHLISIGRRRIAHIAYSSTGIYATDQRLTGYIRALNRAGLVVDDSLILHADFSAKSGYRAMTRLLGNQPNIPDAVFAGSDAVAMGAIAAIQDFGLNVPFDVAVVGLDDIEAAEICRPSLTTVTSKPKETGEAAANTLIDMMSGKTPEKQKLEIKTRLIVRNSTIPRQSAG